MVSRESQRLSSVDMQLLSVVRALGDSGVRSIKRLRS